MSVLIVNAAQAFAKHIDIRTVDMTDVEAPPRNYIEFAFCLEFIDDGRGIAAPSMDIIFEPSYTTKPERYGTGLGLFIARRLAREAGGDLVAVAHDRGKGAMFRLVLPAESVDRGRSCIGASADRCFDRCARR
jgi:signal transduction histidine kinase